MQRYFEDQVHAHVYIRTSTDACPRLCMHTYMHARTRSRKEGMKTTIFFLFIRCYHYGATMQKTIPLILMNVI